MTDKTLQERLRFELSRIADEECYDGGSHQLMFLSQSEARELRDAIDAQAERIKALEGANEILQHSLAHFANESKWGAVADYSEGYAK